MDTSNQNQPQVQQTIVVVGKQKSVGTAFLLAFLFGPLGLLYASVTGGIVMFLLGIVIGIVTFGLGLIIVWIGSIIWAVVAASNANKNVGKGLNINTNFGGQQPQTYQQSHPVQQPVVQPIPQQAIEPEPEQVIQHTSLMTQPAIQQTTPIRTSNKPSFDLGEWFDKNKKSVFVSLGGVVTLLILFVAAKFVFNLDFSKKEKVSTEPYRTTTTSETKQPQENTFKETPATTTYTPREIPKPLVPMVKAARVLPQWTASEEINGDYILIGLYVGAIGKKPIKLLITGVDTINNHVVGYSSVNGNNVDFEGIYNVRLRKASTNQASNIIDFNTYVYNLTLYEPSEINTNGVFQLELNVTDAQGSSGTGSWTSYNGKLYREIALSDTYLAREQ